jgi:D-serine deaminase-like pyridoxal phosphate-dependent protein
VTFGCASRLLPLTAQLGLQRRDAGGRRAGPLRILVELDAQLREVPVKTVNLGAALLRERLRPARPGLRVAQLQLLGGERVAQRTGLVLEPPEQKEEPDQA